MSSTLVVTFKARSVSGTQQGHDLCRVTTTLVPSVYVKVFSFVLLVNPFLLIVELVINKNINN